MSQTMIVSATITGLLLSGVIANELTLPEWVSAAVVIGGGTIAFVGWWYSPLPNVTYPGTSSGGGFWGFHPANEEVD